jgi:hypothetical protein
VERPISLQIFLYKAYMPRVAVCSMGLPRTRPGFLYVSGLDLAVANEVMRQAAMR